MPKDNVIRQNYLYDNSELLGAYRGPAVARKRKVYWVGFLEGARASGRIETDEPQAIEAEATRFCEFFDDADTRDLYLDIGAGCFESDEDFLGSIDLLISTKRAEINEIEPFGEVDHLNEFLGFCGGIICDGRVLESEVAAILERFLNCPVLMEAPAFNGLRAAVRASMQDGVVTEGEADEVQEWLARLVGDGFHDTGIGNIGNVAQFDEAIQDPAEIKFSGKRFVLTGPMRMGTRTSIVSKIEVVGGVFDTNPTRKSDYVIVASTASTLWRTTHYGNKIEKAMRLIDEGFGVRFATETALEIALAKALDTI